MAKKLEALATAKEAPFGKAQDEGTKIFEGLVKEGERFQKHARGLAEETVSEVRDRAADSWDKLEDVFEDRVGRALGKLNVPTKKDVEALRDRVEELTAAVEKLSPVEKSNTAKAAPRGRGRPPRAHAHA